MNRATTSKAPALFLAFLAVGITLGLTTGQEPKEPSFRGRLPAHFGDIVTEAQRQQIYAVQEKYDKQINALQDQLETLKKNRDAEITSVLSEEQRGKLKKKQEEAAASRKKSAEKKAAAK